jgi:hypothetical protein
MKNSSLDRKITEKILCQVEFDQNKKFCQFLDQRLPEQMHLADRVFDTPALRYNNLKRQTVYFIKGNKRVFNCITHQTFFSSSLKTLKSTRGKRKIFFVG